jgi:hypothetical protein
VVAATITATSTTMSAHSAPLARSSSCSTTAPITTATTGSPTIMVGDDAPSSPAWNADCCSSVPATDTTTSADRCTSRSDPKPSAAACTR